MKRKIITSASIYIVFMLYFTLVFLPTFTIATGGHEMVDAYLVDYSKSLLDIETLIHNYGESGRDFMLNFFIADSCYVIISMFLFRFLIQATTSNKWLACIPFATALCDTIENIAVLYSTTTLNMTFIGAARFFATLKAIFLFTSLLIIIVGAIKILISYSQKKRN